MQANIRIIKWTISQINPFYFTIVIIVKFNLLQRMIRVVILIYMLHVMDGLIRMAPLQWCTKKCEDTLLLFLFSHQQYQYLLQYSQRNCA